MIDCRQYQVVKHNGETKDLLLIPTQCARTVLQLALTHLLGETPGDGEKRGADRESVPLTRSQVRHRGLLVGAPGGTLVHEVPQAPTRFSPFALLYGRRSRGLLDLAKEVWEEQLTPPSQHSRT